VNKIKLEENTRERVGETLLSETQNTQESLTRISDQEKEIRKIIDSIPKKEREIFDLLKNRIAGIERINIDQVTLQSDIAQLLENTSYKVEYETNEHANPKDEIHKINIVDSSNKKVISRSASDKEIIIITPNGDEICHHEYSI